MSPGTPSLVLGCVLATTGPVIAPSAVAAAAPTLTSAAPLLDYVSEGVDCPSRNRFVAQVEEALDPAERARVLAAPGTRLRVEIRGGVGGYRGTLEKIDEEGASAARVFVSPICAEVAQALALTAAFSLAPVSASSSTASAPVVVRRPAPTAAPPERGEGDGTPARWSVVVGPVAGGWLSAGIMTGIEGGGERDVPLRGAGGGAGRALTASLRLRTAYVRNDWMGGTPDARFALWSGTLEACGLAALFKGGLEVGLCASGESGWLQASGVRIANPRASDSLWLAFGGGPLARIALGRRWGLELAGGARRPLRHVQFAFDAPEQPAQPLGQTPAVTWTAALFLAARFP